MDLPDVVFRVERSWNLDLGMLHEIPDWLRLVGMSWRISYFHVPTSDFGCFGNLATRVEFEARNEIPIIHVWVRDPAFSSWMQGKISYKHRMLEMVWMFLSLLSLPSTWTDLDETMDGEICCFTYSSGIPQDIQGWDALQSSVLVSQKSKHFLTPKKYCEILSALPTSLPYPSNAKSTTSVGKSHPFIEDLPLKIMAKPSLMGTFPYIFLRFSSIFCRCSPLPSGKLT